MQWAFIVPIILLAAGSVAVVIFSLRQSYRLALESTKEAAEQMRQLTRSHIDIYERMYALVFFFGGDLSVDKTEFSFNDDASMQELFDMNVQIDFELSLLSEKVSENENLMKERGASFKKISTELEEFESTFFAGSVRFNKCVHSARTLFAFKPLRYIFKDLGKCSFRPIVFEKR